MSKPRRQQMELVTLALRIFESLPQLVEFRGSNRLAWCLRWSSCAATKRRSCDRDSGAAVKGGESDGERQWLQRSSAKERQSKPNRAVETQRTTEKGALQQLAVRCRKLLSASVARVETHVLLHAAEEVVVDLPDGENAAERQGKGGVLAACLAAKAVQTRGNRQVSLPGQHLQVVPAQMDLQRLAQLLQFRPRRPGRREVQDRILFAAARRGQDRGLRVKPGPPPDRRRGEAVAAHTRVRRAARSPQAAAARLIVVVLAPAHGRVLRHH